MIKRGVTILLVAGVFTLFASVCFPQDAILQERLSVSSNDCKNPRAASAGGNVLVVWSGKKDNRSRIFFREKINHKWGPELILDRSEWGDNSNPQITLDDKGNPHVVWIFSDLEGYAVYYAFRISDQWFFPDPVTETTDKNCEFPDIGVEAKTGRVFILWQEGRGGKYAIMCSTQDEKGRFASTQVSRPNARGYNIYPQIFISPTPVIAWYELRDSDFTLRAALLNIQTQTWMRYDPAGLENAPFNRLPYIMADEQGILHAVWYDSDGSTDRIFFRRQGDDSLEKVMIVDDSPQWMNSVPTGDISPDGTIYICWRGESVFGGQIFLAVGKGRTYPLSFLESHLISDGQKLFYTQIDCSAGEDGKVNIVWTSSALDGGDGAVYFRQWDGIY